jgi:uncharacterized membrane protein
MMNEATNEVTNEVTNEGKAVLIFIEEQFEAMALLEQVISSLPRRDNIFAGKMLEQYNRTGHLSDKQFSVVLEIIERSGV